MVDVQLMAWLMAVNGLGLAGVVRMVSDRGNAEKESEASNRRS